MVYDGSHGPGFIRFDKAGVYAAAIAIGKLSRNLDPGEYVEFRAAYWDSDPTVGWFGSTTYNSCYLHEFSPRRWTDELTLAFAFKHIEIETFDVLVEPDAVGTYIGLEFSSGNLDADLTANFEIRLCRIGSWNGLDP
jgi:hypothetical protein